MIHSGWPVTGDFFWLQRDPVPLHHGSVFFFNFIFKDAAVVHNAFGRSSIFLFAGHKDAGDTQFFTFLKSQAIIRVAIPFRRSEGRTPSPMWPPNFKRWSFK